MLKRQSKQKIAQFLSNNLAKIKDYSQICLLFVLLLPIPCFAHERWILTSAQIAEWNAKAKPVLFTQFEPTNIIIGLLTLLFLLGWCSLNFTGARELFPDLQARLASYRNSVSVVLRFGLAAMMLMAAFGLNPALYIHNYSTPTLFVPDLQLMMLGSSWLWLKWIEVVLGLMLLLGVYIRFTALMIMALTFLGLYLFGSAILAYIGFLLAITVYLLLRGAGSYYIPLPLPAWSGLTKCLSWLEEQPVERAQFLLRILAGLGFLYGAIAFKIIQPNLALAIVEIYHIPTFGMDPATFVLLMAIVETVAGLLLIAGVLLRPLSLFLFASFIFLGAMIGEGPWAHIFIYGILFACFINSGGRWRNPVAKDKAAEIVILGAGFAGINSAIKLEKLLGKATNVHVTLVNAENYFQFHPLLPEVIGGALQASNIVNPIRCICQQTSFIQGQVQYINPSNHEIEIILPSKKTKKIPYDQLIIALEKQLDLNQLPGLIEHGMPGRTIGDALYLRQHILECLEQAELAENSVTRQALLTFTVISGGLSGTAIVAEVKALIDAALVTYPKINPAEINVYLLELADTLLPEFPPKFSKIAIKNLHKIKIKVITHAAIKAITPQSILLQSQEPIFCHTVINALSKSPEVNMLIDDKLSPLNFQTDDFLQSVDFKNIWLIGDGLGSFKDLPFLISQQIRQGKVAAYNVWATSQGYKLQRWHHKTPSFILAGLGSKASIAHCFSIPIGKKLAWGVSRLSCLVAMPGLEKNLRILLDWVLDAPFRRDIAIISPKLTFKLGRAHYETGDEIIREGDEGFCAYMLLNGKVEVLKDIAGKPQHLAFLEAGECFGEVALLNDSKRSATVKCLTPIDVIVIPQDQFMMLLEGSRELDAAVKSKISARVGRTQE